MLNVTGQVNKENLTEGGKKRKSCSRKSQYLVKSVDEITEEDLDNIAYRSKDKIWDKENVGSMYFYFIFLLSSSRVEKVNGLYFLFRAVPVTSADRRLWTLKQCVAVVSVQGPKASSVGHV